MADLAKQLPLPTVHLHLAQTSAFGEKAEDLMNLLQLLIPHAEAHNLVHMILAALAVVALHCPLRLPVCVAELSLSQSA